MFFSFHWRKQYFQTYHSVFATCNKGLSFLLTEFICIFSATVTQQGVFCPLTSQLTSCIACLTIIACTPYYTILDFAFATSGNPVAYIPRWLHPVLQYGFIIEDCSLQQYRGDAGSPVVTQVGYLWPPATSTSLFHGWQKECQSSSS